MNDIVWGYRMLMALTRYDLNRDDEHGSWVAAIVNECQPSCACEFVSVRAWMMTCVMLFCCYASRRLKETTKV